MAKKKQKTETDKENLLALIRERFCQIHTAELHIRAAALEDIKFCYNIEEGQWPSDIRNERMREGRPCLTANKLRKFVAIVANQERENRIAIKVRPVDDKADAAVAQIMEDLIRQIEYQSRADEVYTLAGEQALAGGFGYWRILTRYVEDSFDQEIYIEPIENQFSVYMDPKKRFCFITDYMPLDEFRSEYPDAAPVDFSYEGLGEKWTLWYQPDKIRVAEYFQKEPVIRELVQVLNPLTKETQIFELKDGLTIDDLIARGFQILKTRKFKGHKVRWYKVTGHEILEERDWPGSEIPVVEVVGDRVNIEGKIYKRSLIRDGKDPQRMYNYWLTTETETVALQPKSPFLVTPQEISGFEEMWNEANRKNFPYLLYNAQGQRVPKREPPPQVSSGHLSLLNLANNDIKDTLGMYESFLGEPSNERSGAAIFARQRRSQIGVFHFPDNLRRAIVETGRILIDLIPKIYDTERIIRVRNEQGIERLVKINERVVDLATGKEMIVNDLSVGRYDVQADTRVYSTRRQETVEMLIQAMQYAPQVAPLLVDLIFKYLDSPGASEVEERIKRFLGAQALQAETGGLNEPTSVGQTMPSEYETATMPQQMPIGGLVWKKKSFGL